MPRKPTGRPNGRPRKTSVSDGVNLVDTVEDIIEDTPPQRVQPPREKKAGPKKVLDETGKAIADAGASIVAAKTPIHFDEAQSLTTPTVRLVGRRLPKLLKNVSPKIKMNPDDAADIEEITATLVKVFLRLLAELIQEIIKNQGKAKAAQQQQQAQGAARPVQPAQPVHVANIVPIRPDVKLPQEQESKPENTGFLSGPHNPAFDLIGTDMGFEGA